VNFENQISRKPLAQIIFADETRTNKDREFPIMRQLYVLQEKEQKSMNLQAKKVIQINK
jgi:hypothetical protein